MRLAMIVQMVGEALERGIDRGQAFDTLVPG